MRIQKAIRLLRTFEAFITSIDDIINSDSGSSSRRESENFIINGRSIEKRVLWEIDQDYEDKHERIESLQHMTGLRFNEAERVVEEVWGESSDGPGFGTLKSRYR